MFWSRTRSPPKSETFVRLSPPLMMIRPMPSLKSGMPSSLRSICATMLWLLGGMPVSSVGTISRSYRSRKRIEAPTGPVNVPVTAYFERSSLNMPYRPPG